MSDLVTRVDKDGLAILTLNRPDKLNSLTVGMFRELRDHVSDLYKDDTIGCVVLRGAGRCFSAGHDLADISEGEKVPSRGWHSETLRLMERLARAQVRKAGGGDEGAVEEIKRLELENAWGGERRAGVERRAVPPSTDRRVRT